MLVAEQTCEDTIDTNVPVHAALQAMLQGVAASGGDSVARRTVPEWTTPLATPQCAVVAVGLGCLHAIVGGSQASAVTKLVPPHAQNLVRAKPVIRLYSAVIATFLHCCV